MKYKVFTPWETLFDVPLVKDNKVLTEDERNLLAIEIARNTYGEEIVVVLGGEEIMRPADIRKEGRMPTVEELQEFYETQARPRAGDGWTPSNQHISHDFGRTKFALEHIEPGMSVLENGVQDGGMTKHLVAATEGGYFTGIDISPTYIERTGAYLDNLGLLGSNVELVVTDANTFSTRRRYDVIVAMEILEHVPDPRQLMRNLWGLLRKNSGKILVTVPEDWADSEGEHLHNFHESDIIQIIGEATGIRPPVWREGPWLFAVVEKGGAPYEP